MSILLVAFVAASPAAAELPGESSPLLPNTGNIRGTVTDENGDAVEGLQVCAMSEYTNPAFTYCGGTDESGQYLIYDMPMSNYKVFAEPMWYLSQFRTVNYPQVWYPGGVRHPEEATWVPVTGEHTTTGIDFHVHVGGTISGTVTDAVTGTPIKEVEACPVWIGTHQRGEQQSCGFTDAEGHYLIGNVDSDEYTVEFKAGWTQGKYRDGFYTGKGGTEPLPVSVTAGQATTGIDGRLQSVDPTPLPHDATPPATEGETPQVDAQPSVLVGVPSARPGLTCRKGKRKAMKAGHLRCVRIHRSTVRPAHR